MKVGRDFCLLQIAITCKGSAYNTWSARGKSGRAQFSDFHISLPGEFIQNLVGCHIQLSCDVTTDFLLHFYRLQITRIYSINYKRWESGSQGFDCCCKLKWVVANWIEFSHGLKVGFIQANRELLNVYAICIP